MRNYSETLFKDLFDFGAQASDMFCCAGTLKTVVKKLSDKFVLIAEVPGLSEEDIMIEFKDNVLHLTADYKKDSEEFTKIRQGKWESFHQFKDIDTENILAKLDKGQLFITLPKKPEAQPFKIQINKGNI